MSQGGQDPAKPIQTQPQWQSASGTSHPGQYSRPYPVVPPGIESLVEVDEVTFRKKVFETPDGQILYSVKQDWECCGNPLILKLKDPNKQEVLHAHLLAESKCCSSFKELQVEAPPGYPIAFVSYREGHGLQFAILNKQREPIYSYQITSFSAPKNPTEVAAPPRDPTNFGGFHYGYDLLFSISDEQRKPIFTSQVSSLSFPFHPTEICSVQGSHPIGRILKIKGKPSKIVIQFPRDLEAKMKAVILVTYLYMQCEVDGINSQNTVEQPAQC
ncbi:phospholipid scramblase 1-like [Xenopus tropicalis]|uniref:Phospholipid scramblase 1-like n=1 Tax=Xenopus tropicalis TaxID=8364 RepID=A0A8J1JC04_XENTR|nr:phospholipid scramblase 1-like [Xenopus tropicalis]